MTHYKPSWANRESCAECSTRFTKGNDCPLCSGYSRLAFTARYPEVAEEIRKRIMDKEKTSIITGE